MSKGRGMVFVAIALLGVGARTSAEEHPPIVRHLAEAIRYQTISNEDADAIDASAFEAFRSFLRTTYPRVFGTLEVATISGHSLLIRWSGQDPALAPVLFDAHYDVVPIEPGTEGDWTHPPFSGLIEDGYVWGRGAIDDKMSVIATFEALEALIAEGFAPARTLYFAFGHDEEAGGFRGAAAMARHLEENGVRLAYMVGEGGGVVLAYPLMPDRTVAMIALAEKEYVTFRLFAEGQGGHSSSPPEDSALVRVARAVTRIHEQPLEAKLVPPVDMMFREVGAHTGGLTGFMLRNQWLAGPMLVSQLADDPVGRSLVRTTTAVTLFDAGIKENVVPQRAEATVNLRLLPGDTVESVKAEVAALIDDEQVVIEARSWGESPPVADPDGPGYARIRAAIEEAVPGAVVIPGLLTATTDTRHYRALTDDLYRFHPMHLDLSEPIGVHDTNERVSIEGVVRSVALSRALIERVAAP